MRQHVPEPYSHFFNADDVMMHGPQQALDKCKDRFEQSDEYRATRESSKASWWSKMNPFGSADSGKMASLDTFTVKAQAREHAAALLRGPWHWTEHMLPLLQHVVQAVASPLVASVLESTAAFPRTRKGAPPQASGCS